LVGVPVFYLWRHLGRGTVTPQPSA